MLLTRTLLTRTLLTRMFLLRALLTRMLILLGHMFLKWYFLGKTGNSNTGNTARAAFDDYETFAEILGWDEHVDLVRDLHYLILAVNSTNALDPDLFDEAAQSWLDRFHDSPFAWNTLNPTVHSLLHHGADLIRYFRAPIGLFSEEGPEANNKIIRQVSEPFSSKLFYFSLPFCLQSFIEIIQFFNFIQFSILSHFQFIPFSILSHFQFYPIFNFDHFSTSTSNLIIYPFSLLFCLSLCTLFQKSIFYSKLISIETFLSYERSELRLHFEWTKVN